MVNKDLLDLEANTGDLSSSSSSSVSSLPKTQVLGKVKDFLGVFSESNKRLMEDAKERPQSYDIEVDLMLGIADLHTPEAVAAAESAMMMRIKNKKQKLAQNLGPKESFLVKKQKPKKRPKIVEVA